MGLTHIERTWPTPADEARDRLLHPAEWTRYEFASKFAKGLHVLDCACGAGYGSWLLAGAGAASVIGVDLDPAALAHARRHFARPAVEFREGSADSLPLHSGSVGLAVCLETIEHVRDPVGFLAELARALAPGGTLLLSTPLTRGPARLHPENPYHVREYDEDELAELLSARFAIVERLGMHSRESRRFADLKTSGGGLGKLVRSGAHRFVPRALRELARGALLRPRADEPLAWVSAERWQEAPVQVVVARPLVRET